MKKLKFVVLIASVVAGQQGAFADQTVKIGYIGPLTGPQAQSGKDTERGVRLAVDELNDGHIKIAGTPVRFELVSADDQGDPKTGVTAAQKLVDDGVTYVIGHFNSGVNIPAAKVYNDARVVNITPAASNPDLTKLGYPYIFRLSANDNVMGARVADYAAKTLKLSRVAVVDDRAAYGAGVADVFVQSAKADGMQVLSREYGTVNTTDFKAILTKIKAQKPQAVFYGGYYAQAAVLGRQMKELGMDAVLLGGDGICSPQLGILSNGTLDKRAYCAQGGAPLDTLAGGKDFRTKFKSKFGVDVDVYAPAYYAATLVAAQGMQKANSVDPQAVAKTLASQSFASLLGPVRFDKQGEWIDAPVTIYTLQGASLESVTQK